MMKALSSNDQAKEEKKRQPLEPQSDRAPTV